MSCSIIIPTKDRPNSLKCAVTSALDAIRQIGGGEVIVVDDDSGISASKSLKNFVCEQLRIYSNENSPGPAGARNHGVQKAMHKVIFFLDDDDRIVPDYCQRICDTVLEIHEDVGFGFSRVFKTVIGPDGNRNTTKGRGLEYDRKFDAHVALSHRMAGLGCGFWVKKRVFVELGGLDESLTCNEDTEFCIRLAEARVLGWYNSTPGVTITENRERMAIDRGNTFDIATPAVRAICFEKIIDKHSGFLLGQGKVRRRLVFQALKYRLKGGMVHECKAFLLTYRPLVERVPLLLLVCFAIGLIGTNRTWRRICETFAKKSRLLDR